MILEVVEQLAGVGVKCNGRVRVEVVTRPCVPGPRATVADSPVRDVERGIEGAGHPDRSPTGLPRISLPSLTARIARSRDCVPSPAFIAVHGVERRNKPSNAVLAAGGADHDHAVHHQRRHGDVVGAAVIRNGRGSRRLGRLPP